MKTSRFAMLLALAALLIVAVIGCAPPAPVTLDSIAVPTGAQATTNPIYVQLQNSVVQGLKTSQDVNFGSLDSKVYTLAQTTQWSDIEKFYDNELGKGNWKTDPKMVASNAAVHGKGWARGQQVMAIFFIADPNVPDALLLTALGNVKQ